MNRHQTKYLNTAKKMNQALIRLLKTQTFSSITIKDICAEACVNRSTFYSHYENMADLLEDTRQYITSLFPAHHGISSSVFLFRHPRYHLQMDEGRLPGKLY